MAYTQHFFVEGRYMGAAERNAIFCHEQLARPYSYAFFCPKCGDVWARCPVEGRIEFNVLTRDCRRHPPAYLSVPGSLMLEWEKEFGEAFPPELVQWEFERHMELFKQGETA